jgi:subtilase family serine protease
MRHTIRRLLAVAVVAAAVATPSTVAAATVPVAASDLRTACAAAPAGIARCLAKYRRHAGTGPLSAGTAPAGYGATDLRSAYNLPATGGTGTVAIVDAYGLPAAESDLAVYRSEYGLPACTQANGCLTIVNQSGDTSPLPSADDPWGWGVETSLDLDMASAGCPTCKILLVQANTPSVDDLSTAVDTAVRLGASVVSNSYGGDEFNGMENYDAHYQHPGVPILVSSGDFGFGTPSFPAVLTSTIAVGGTSLRRANGARGWTESAWSGSGSGCSGWISKPAWQHDGDCSMRTNTDISAVADPDTGVAIYDTYGLDDWAGWLVAGGTSASSPFVAGIIALAGHPDTVTAKRLYSEPKAFHDIVGGSNGYCGGGYLCTGVRGYDGPTGLGSPNGFQPFA